MTAPSGCDLQRAALNKRNNGLKCPLLCTVWIVFTEGVDDIASVLRYKVYGFFYRVENDNSYQ